MSVARTTVALCTGLACVACAQSPPAPRVRDTPGDVAAPVAGGGGSGGASDPGSTVSLPNLEALFEESCATATAQAELVPANLLFVLDRSASMVCNPPPTTDSVTCETTNTRASLAVASKWEVVTEALLAAISGLPPDTRVAVSYFSIDDTCGVFEEPTVPLATLAEGQLGAVRASLGSVTPEGSTPLVGATILGYRYLHGEALAGRITGPRFVVLVTDGEQAEECNNPPSCNTADECREDLYAAVADAAGDGVNIRTFVVGVPGSEASRVVLSRIAVEGGTARDGCPIDQGDCHFDVSQGDDFGAALAGALDDIELRTVTCELPVPRMAGAALDPELVNVVYTPGDDASPALVLQDSTRACDGGADGWQYSPDATRIRLCGAICETVRADVGARVDVVLGCETRRPE